MSKTLVMGPCQKFLTRFGSDPFLLLGLGWVSHFRFGFEKFPVKSHTFQFFPFGSKKYLWVGAKNTLDKDGSAYAQVESGQGPALQSSQGIL